MAKLRYVLLTAVFVSAVWLLPALTGKTSTLTAANSSAAIGHLGGTIHTIKLRNSLAYLNEGASLVILDLTHPVSPTVLSKITLLDDIGMGAIAVTDHYAYVADGDAGLYIIDISDPVHPVQRGVLNTPGSASGVSVAGTYAYVADGNAGLRIVDVSDPAQPTEAGFYPLPNWSSSITLSGTLAYVTAQYAGLHVIDVAQPAQPTEVVSYTLPTDADDVVIADHYAYVADEIKGLRIIDITEPTHLHEVGFYETTQIVQGVAVEGKYAYLAATAGGLLVVDVSDPYHPQQVGSYLDAAWAQDVAVMPGWAYLADVFGSLWILDITEPTQPIARGAYRVPAYIDALAATADLAYVMDLTNERLWVIDGTTAPQPSVKGSSVIATTGWYGQLGVVGNYAYIVENGSGLHIVDVSSPTQPQELGKILPWPTGVSASYNDFFIKSNRAYVVGTVGVRSPMRGAYPIYTSAYLWVIDISQPAEPSQVAFYKEPNSFYGFSGVAVVDHYAYCVGEMGLRVIDIADAAKLTLVGAADVPGSDVVMMGHYAYIPAGDMLHIVDITTPTSPTLKSDYQAPGSITALTRDQNSLYMLLDQQRLYRLDLAAPTAPRAALVSAMPTLVTDVVVRGTKIYASGYMSGLFVIELDHLYLPLVLKSS